MMCWWDGRETDWRRRRSRAETRRRYNTLDHNFAKFSFFYCKLEPEQKYITVAPRQSQSGIEYRDKSLHYTGIEIAATWLVRAVIVLCSTLMQRSLLLNL